MNSKLLHNRFYILILVLSMSCVEEVDLKNEVENFTSALVVEATLTDELKQQEILLSRTYELEEDGPSLESGASVKVIGNGVEYQFQQNISGVYVSNVAFAAEPNIDYHLEITTLDGRQYSSSVKRLTQQTQIDDVYFEIGLNENNEAGISVLVDSYDPTGNSKFYRYTYEETYKIIAPSYLPLDYVVVEHTLPLCPVFAFQPKEDEQEICYNTVKSNTIIIENTNLFEEDRVDRFRVRFLNRNNYIISHRYSILVNQFVQSSEAHEFYRVLSEMSSDDNIFSQLQPGFLNGNMVSITNTSENVVGYFEVSSVDTKRIYFNYADLFPGEALPPYYISCNPFAPEICNPAGGSGLADALNTGSKYLGDNLDAIEGEGDIDLVLPACGDCRVLGNNVPPDFWVED